MFKFFRRVRQTLLSENKFSKYFLYALGEILLIVIGILLALQINNWNEERNDKRLEYSYVELLTRDLKSDSVSLVRLVNSSNASVISKNIIRAYQEGEIPKPDSLSTHFLRSVFPGISSFVPNKGAINEIQNAGGFSLIKNEEVRNQILKLYNTYEEMEKNVGRYHLDNNLTNRDLVYEKANGNLFITNLTLDEELLKNLIFDNEIRNRLINNWAITYNIRLKEVAEINAETIRISMNYLQEFKN